MEPGHKSQGFGRQKADLTCIWSGRWPGGSAAGKWTHALLGLILTCLSSTSTTSTLIVSCCIYALSKTKRCSTGKHLFLKSYATLSAFSVFAPQFWRLSGSRQKKIRDKTIQTFKKGEKVNLNRIWKEKQQMYCQNARRKKKKTCLTGEVFICISVVHANIKHLMSAFFRDTDERKRDARLTLSSHNQTVTRFSKQLAAQLSWHQTLTLQ